MTDFDPTDVRLGRPQASSPQLVKSTSGRPDRRGHAERRSAARSSTRSSSRMPTLFRADRAGSTNAVIHWTITGRAGRRHRHLRGGHRRRHLHASPRPPSATRSSSLTMGPVDFLQDRLRQRQPGDDVHDRQAEGQGRPRPRRQHRRTSSTSPRPEPMPEFSLDLNEEQRDLRDWVHGFAADVVRPAAAEWDEREETPWPVIQEAAKIGLYGFEFLANTLGRPDRAVAVPSPARSCSGATPASGWPSWARRSPSPRSTAPARRTSWSSGCRSASATPTTPTVAAFCSTEPEAGSDVGAMRTRAATTRPPTSGSSMDRRRTPPTAASPTCTW